MPKKKKKKEKKKEKLEKVQEKLAELQHKLEDNEFNKPLVEVKDTSHLDEALEDKKLLTLRRSNINKEYGMLYCLTGGVFLSIGTIILYLLSAVFTAENYATKVTSVIASSSVAVGLVLFGVGIMYFIGASTIRRNWTKVQHQYTNPFQSPAFEYGKAPYIQQTPDGHDPMDGDERRKHGFLYKVKKAAVKGAKGTKKAAKKGAKKTKSASKKTTAAIKKSAE